MTTRSDATDASSGSILLTGATGLLGGEVLDRLLAGTERKIYAIVRRPLELEHERLHLIFADLSEDRPLPPMPADITTVIHCAASVSFVLPIEEQRAINVEGTRRLLDAASTLPNLERFQHVSTAYIAGYTEGEFHAHELDRGQRWRNTYEQSKWEAEMLVRSYDLPVQVVRPAIVVGDSKTGRTTSFNVIYPPLKAYSRGTFTFAPGSRDGFLDAVPIDYIADSMIALLEHEPGSTHILAACEKAGRLGEIIDLGAERFNCPVGQLLPQHELEALIEQLPDEPREKAKLALERSKAMLPYFNVKTEYRDPDTIAFLAERGIEAPALRDYFDVLMDYCEATDWGKKPEDAPAVAHAA